MKTRSKRISRLVQAMLETADDMKNVGILDEAAHQNITMRHLGVAGNTELARLSGFEGFNDQKPFNIKNSA